MRTRLRRLRAEGRTFVWRAEIGFVHGDGVDVHRCINVRVWGDGKNSRPLVADLLSKSKSVGWTPAATDGAYPDASDIRTLINRGLELGWQVEARGGSFLLTENSDLELAGFLITDRPRRPDAPDPTARVMQADESQANTDT
ncbi:hypothetical protein IU450_38915 [Nocardia abscessus]|uniref:hypothetical protein n=1 Tax=Nocardia abscessus TaxID=120957 RepID=UPI0018957488|nr:hypothetical protein [Nocardia abscessus]MBF6341810.1 hypothetical protein [Nocardia abscessus]